jgi:hypothetical protein
LSILVGFGLSETTARVYLSLVDQPVMTASALASAANVPRSHLYNVLQELQALGLVEVFAEETRRSFRAKPFADFLALRCEELRQQIAAMERAASLAEALRPPPLDRDGPLEAGEVRLVLGRRAVAREIDAMLQHATREIVMASSDNGRARIARHLARWAGDRGASRPGPRVRIFVPPAPSGWMQPDVDGGVEAEVRHFAQPRAMLSVAVDEGQLLVVHPIPDTPDERVGRDFAILTSDRVFARGHVQLLASASLPGPPAPEPAASRRVGRSRKEGSAATPELEQDRP